MATAKGFLRVTQGSEDVLVEALLDGAERLVGDALNLAVHKGTWVLTFPGGLDGAESVELPRPPYVSLDKVEKWDETTDAWVTIALADFKVRQTDPLAVVYPAKGKSFPVEQVRLEYTAGYTDANVTAAIKQAVLDVVAQSYERRGDDPSATLKFIRERYHNLVVPWV